MNYQPTEYQPQATQLAQDPAARLAAEDSVDPVWKIGDVILDTYEVKDIFTSGGMGLVYRVHHNKWNMDLAVKAPRSELFQSEAQKQNFIRECDTWINLGLHPHIVSCHYVRTLGGIPRVFAEYMDGGSLEDWIQSGKLYEGGKETVLERILDIAIQMAWGLEYAHEKELVHQDFKPANVMMAVDGTAKVTDFGLTSGKYTENPVVDDDISIDTPLHSGTIVAQFGGMTQAYCSPEQAAAWAEGCAGIPREQRTPITRKTDVWSWGVSLLEMFLGYRPGNYGQAATEYLKTYLDEEHEIDCIPRMPESMGTLLSRCFQVSTHNRPTINDVVRELKDIFEITLVKSYRREFIDVSLLNAASMNNHGISEFDLGNYPKALDLLSQALMINPNHPEATFNLGLYRWRSGLITDLDLVNSLLECAKIYKNNQSLSRYIDLVNNERGSSTLISKSGGHQGAIEEIQISDGGKYALSQDITGKYLLWDVQNGICVDELKKNFLKNGLKSLNGNYWIDTNNELWLMPENKKAGKFISRLDSISEDYSLVEELDRNNLFMHGNLSLKKGQRILHTITNLTGRINRMAISCDGCFGVVATSDNAISIIRFFPGEPAHYVLAQPQKIIEISANQSKFEELMDKAQESFQKGDCNEAARYCDLARNVEGYEHSPRIFDLLHMISKFGKKKALRTGWNIQKFSGSVGAINSLAISSDEKMLLIGGSTLQLWDIVSERCIREFGNPKNQINHVAFSNTNKFVYSSSNQLQEWDIETGELSRETEEGPIRCFALSPDGSQICCAIRSDIIVLSLSSFEIEFSLIGHSENVNSISFVREGSHLLSGSDDGLVKLWNLADGVCVRTMGTDIRSVQCICPTQNSRFVLSATGGSAHLWEIETGKRIHILRDFIGSVVSISITTDGRFAISTHMDGALKVWQLSTGKCIHSIENEKYPIMASVLLMNDCQLITGDYSGKMKFWELDWDYGF